MALVTFVAVAVATMTGASEAMEAIGARGDGVGVRMVVGLGKDGRGDI